MTAELEEDKSNNPFGLERSSEQGMRLVRSESLLKRGLNSISALDQILRFPDDNTNCGVFSYETGSSLVDWFEYIEPWRPVRSEPFTVQCHGLARGPFKCPEGKKLILVLNGEVEPSLKILAGLHSNSVTGLLMLDGFSNPDFLYLKNFKGLTCISIRESDVDDDALSHLVNLGSLQYLDLWRTAVTDSGLAQLSNLRHLTHLNLLGTNVTGEFVEQIPQVKNTLRDLSISGRMVTDDTLGYISRLSALSFLKVESEHITGHGASLLKNNSALVKLDVRGSNIADIDLNGLEMLTSLNLFCPGIGDVDLKGISSLPNLRSLNLEGTEVGDRAMDAISSIESLTSLNLDQTKITEKSIESLLKLKSLKQLHIAHTPLLEVGLEILEDRFPDSVYLHADYPHFSWAPSGRSALWEDVAYFSQRLA